MNSKNVEVLRKILYAVETGGQVYGEQDYKSLIGAGHNISNEVAITIGAGQWYASEARTLMLKILGKYPKVFRKYDSSGIEKDLKKSWETYNLSVTSTKAKEIVRIISTDEGIKCQDELMEEQIRSYASEIVADHGNLSDQAVMECINIRHQGGSGALTRILGKAKRPYTLDSIYAALCTDPSDPKANQVGDYVDRQRVVYSFIKKYSVGDDKEEKTVGVTADDYIGVFQSWVGWSEANGKYKKIIDLYNSMKPLPRGYAVQYDDEWCDTTVSAAAIKAKCVDLVGRECGCEEHVKIFKKLGIWIEDGTVTPEKGWIIVYSWKSAKQPNDSYSSHIGVVESVANGYIVAIEGNRGEVVTRRTIPIGWGYIRGFASPKFAKTSSTIKPSTGGSSGTKFNTTPKWYGKINTKELSIRTWAGDENNKLKSYPTLKQGVRVGICDYLKASNGDTWYYIQITGTQGTRYGFANADYIIDESKYVDPSTVKTDHSVLQKDPYAWGTVTADVLNVRKWAGTEYSRLVSIPQIKYGREVGICGEVKDTKGKVWFFIYIKDNAKGVIHGFVHSDYIKVK